MLVWNEYLRGGKQWLKKSSVIGVDDSRHPDWPYYSAAREIVKLMEKLYHYGLGYRAFETWIEMCHLSLDAMPDVVHHVAQGGQLGDYRDTPAIHERWERLTHDMREEALDIYAQAFGILLEATHTQTLAVTQPHHVPVQELTYADVVGNVFQFFGMSKSHQSRAGIFFTPWNVAWFMAQMMLATYDFEADLKARYVKALSHPSVEPAATALSWGVLAASSVEDDGGWASEAFLTKLLPLVRSSPDWEPFTIIDPCCGSGVMLLAAAKVVPRWALDCGFIQLYGVDIEPLCVEMCRLNMRLYGLSPSGIDPVDLLTLAQMQALPEPHKTLYENAVADAPPGRDHWIEQVNQGRVGQLNLFDKEVG